jgi:hypothetical protein
MPKKNPTERFGGPGSSKQDRSHPEKGGREHDLPSPGAPTSGSHSRYLAGEESAISITRTTTTTGAEKA